MANSVNILLGVGLLSVPYALRQGGWAGLGVLAALGLMTNYTGKALIRCQTAGSLPPLPADVEAARRETDRRRAAAAAAAAAASPSASVDEQWIGADPSASCLDAGGAVAASRMGRDFPMGARGELASAVECSFDDDDDDDDPHDLLTVAPRRRPLMSYEDIGEAAFGSSGRSFITWVLYTELVGTCALFFILEGDHLALLFEGSGKDSAWFQAASAAVMVPTLWLADLSSLSYVGAVGALASISLMGVIAYELIAVGGFPGTLPAGLETTAALHLATLPVSFGLLAFVFAGHAVFPAIYSSMEKPEEYEGMLDKTYAIVGVTCAVIGAAGYALWGDAVKDEVTLNLPAGALSTLALALITVNPFSKFALTMDPVARGLESRLGVDIGAKEGDGPIKARVMRTGLGLGALVTAAKVPFFAVVMSLIGSFLTLTVSVIFPSACYLKMFEDELDEGEKAINWIIMFVGGFCVVAGSTSALEEISNAAF